MADLNKELAKAHLERRGYLVALDVPFDEEGGDGPAFDLVGVEIVGSAVVRAAVGVVRGWWHAGSYLAPGLIRSHLETDKRFLSEAFSPERIEYLRGRFGMGTAPISNVLFFSKRSPGKSAEAEKILAAMDIEVVYLEDVLMELLPLVGKQPLGEGDLAQVLSMIRYSRLFQELRRALREVRRLREDPDAKPRERERGRREKPSDPQLDFLQALTDAGDDEDDEQE